MSTHFESLIIPSTRNTPFVNFDAVNGVFEITGRSTPEYPTEFYSRLNIWLARYVEQPNMQTIIRIQLEYFNTSSSKCLLELLRRLHQVRKKNGKVAVEWIYEKRDEDMRETGKDLSELLGIPFSIVMTG
jgi:hypothetical protein